MILFQVHQLLDARQSFVTLDIMGEDQREPSCRPANPAIPEAVRAALTSIGQTSAKDCRRRLARHRRNATRKRQGIIGLRR